MLEENGRLLKTARETRSLTYAEVEEATKVREYYLQLLEAGDLAKLPGRIYALGFAETYARYLGLDPAPIVADIKAYYAANSPDSGFEAYVSGKKVVQTVAEGGAFVPEVQEKGEKHLADRNTKAEDANKLRTAAYANAALGRPIRTRKRRFGKRFLWVLLGSLMVVLLLVLYTLQGNGDIPGATDDNNNVPGVTVPEAAPISIIVTAKDEAVWVGANVDNGNSSQVTLQPGISYAFEGQELVYLRFNNAGHTEVMYNGQILTGYNEGNAVWNMNFYPDSWVGFADSADTATN